MGTHPIFESDFDCLTDCFVNSCGLVSAKMMSSVLYLEQFIESLEPLPGELQKNFYEMRQMDEKLEVQKAMAESMADEYNRNANDMSEADLKSNFRKVEAAWQSANKMQEEKVQLATQTYEMVDRHIRRLDSDLSRFESELAERGGLETSSPHSDKKNARNRRGAEGDEEKGGAGGFQIAAQDVLDMPVDPNEPTYCSCHQVSYGEMIGCDNPDCPIEWFHFGCVGLTSKPKGKWYCVRCKPAFESQLQKKKKK